MGKEEDDRPKSYTFSKSGTLPTLEKLMEEMALLDEQTQDIERKKGEMQGLIEMNKRLKARNTFLEKENGTLRLDKNSHSTKSFDFPTQYRSDNSSNVELMVYNKRHAAHEDDRLIVKFVTSFIFLFLPILLGVGVWAGCLLHSTETKMWYDGILESPFKLDFYIFGGVWCGVYGFLGVGIYSTWYQMGGRRGIPYILLGCFAILIALSYPPILLVGHWILPSMSVIGALWLVLVLCIALFSRTSIFSGIAVIPVFLWTTYTAMFTFFPFYNEYFDSKFARIVSSNG